MKDNNDNKTIDFIKIDKEHEHQSEFMDLLTSVLLLTRRLSKKDNEVFLYIVWNSKTHENLKIDVKEIAEKAFMPVTNVYRHIKNLEDKKVIIKNDNEKYCLNINDAALNQIKYLSEHDL